MGTARTSPKVVRARRAKGIQARRGKVKRHFPKSERTERHLREQARDAKVKEAPAIDVEAVLTQEVVAPKLVPLPPTPAIPLASLESEPAITKTLAHRFWQKVQKLPNDGCWLWKGFVNSRGYPKIVMSADGISRRAQANRIAWQLVVGEIPTGLLRRVCPSTRCVRPDHFRDEAKQDIWAAPSRQIPNPMPVPKLLDVAVRAGEAESELTPLLLYRGQQSLGRVQALMNLTLAGDQLGVGKTADLAKLTKRSPEFTHMLGLHKPVQITSLERFWARLILNPTILNMRPGLSDYVKSIEADTANAMWQRLHPQLEALDRNSPWTELAWRRIAEKSFPDPIAREVWPFMPELPDKPLDGHELVLAVDDAVPKHLPEVWRQEVCQDLVLAVLDGEIRIADLQASAGEFVKRVWKQFPIKYGHLSLDQPAPWRMSDDPRTLGDLLVNAGWKPERNTWGAQ